MPVEINTEQIMRKAFDETSDSIRVESGANSVSTDAFGRSRVSGTGQRFDIEFIYDKQPTLMDEVTAGGGTATHNANPRDVYLAVNDAVNATEAALYSYDIPYTPGNSQLIEITGTLNDAEISGGEMSIFLRESLGGSVNETEYLQSAWSNTVNDTDWSKSHIFQIDFQSLKVGRLRFALVIGGVSTPVLEIVNDNLRKTGYWQTPMLPVYWRIYNDATYTYAEVGYGDIQNGVGFRYKVPVNASAALRAICATVKSEGGKDLFDIPGFVRSADNGVTPQAVSTTLIPLLSIRPSATLNSITNRGLYIPTTFNVTTSEAIRLVLLYRPTLTGASWGAVDSTYSGMEVDDSATSVSGGIEIESDYLAEAFRTDATASGLLDRTLLKLGRTGTSDILTLAAVRTGTVDATVLASIKWKEVR